MPDLAITSAITTQLIQAIRAVVGDRGLLTDLSDTAAASEDWRRLYKGRTSAVVRPANTDEVAAVVRLCAAAGVPIVTEHRAAQPGARSRSGGHDDDDRSRCDAEGRAARGG
jgi:FAD/FMN-containing dehydrogenase